MNYSSVSDKTNGTVTDDFLSDVELGERYYLIKTQFNDLLCSYEAIKQELHETKRSYQTALDIQSHLSAELEIFQVDEAKLKSELHSRISSLQEEISQLREDRVETAERHASEIKSLEDQIGMLKQEQVIQQRKSPLKERDNQELEAAQKLISKLRAEALSAQETLEEALKESLSLRQNTEELMNEMNKWRMTADLRREELQAARESEATVLADLEEAKAMLHQYTNPQDVQPHAAKGNSIFAEVEDKRQEMAKNLISMKQTNSRLRRELANKQAEVEALLHEKQTIWEEQIGAASHYDKELIESYEERITQLESACERQRREQARWFNKLSESPASGWLTGVFEHLKSECEKLRNEVSARGTAQLASAIQVRELRRKLAVATANSAKVVKSPDDRANREEREVGHEVANGVGHEVVNEEGHEVAKEVVEKTITARPVKLADDVKKKVCFE